MLSAVRHFYSLDKSPLQCCHTFSFLFSFLSCVLALFPYDGQTSEICPGLVRLPLHVKLLVPHLGLLFLQLLSKNVFIALKLLWKHSNLWEPIFVTLHIFRKKQCTIILYNRYFLLLFISGVFWGYKKSSEIKIAKYS